MSARPLAALAPALALALATLASGAALAQDRYPSRPIRMILPFPPGGSVDTVARLLAPLLTESLGQQVVVENRSGASGNIGTELAARAAPDGYTLMVNTIPFVANVHLYPKMPVNALTDFAPISLLCQAPSVMAVNPKVQAKTVNEFLELARANPGKLNFATAGPATNPHIGGELVNFLGKTEIVAIHYKGGGPAIAAAVAGDVELVVSGIAEVMPQVAGGRLRALGVTGLARSKAFPELPTISESGLPGYEFTTWHALVAPKNTPPAIVALLNERVKRGMTSAAGRASYEKIGYEVIASTPDELATHLKDEVAKWGRVIKERNMKAD